MDVKDITISRRGDLDFLRGLGLILVIITHTFPKLLPGGFIGVDFFFVISGFLITKNSINDQINKNFSIVTYYLKRIKRIIPPTLIVFFIFFHIFLYYCNPLELRIIIEQIQSSMLFVNNFHTYYVTRYFDNGFMAKPFIHFWSLSLEEQYYLIWPFLFIGIINLRFKYKFIVFLSLTIISFIFSTYLCFTNTSAAYLLLPSRMWQILSGVLLALNLKKISIKIKSSNIISILGFMLITIGCLIADHHFYPGIVALLPTLGTAIFITSENSKINKYLSKGFVVHLGRISYTMYLVHMPMLSVLYYTYHTSVIEKVFAIISTYFLSLILYHLVEKPTTELKDLSKIKKVNIFTIFSCILFFSYISLYNYDFIFTDYKKHELKIAKEFYNDGLDGQFRFKTNLCKYNTDSEFIIIGDSHAAQYLGAAKNYKSIDVGLFQQGILPTLNIDYTTSNFNNDIFKKCLPKLLENENIKTFIFSFRIPVFITGHLNKLEHYEKYEGKFYDDKQRTNFEILIAIYDNLLKQAKKYDKKIVFFTPTPIGSIRPREIKKCLLSGKEYNICDHPIDQIETNNEYTLTYRFLDELKKSNTFEVFNIKDSLCVDKCNMIKNKKPIFRDDDHLTNHGANIVLESFSSTKQN